MPKKIRAKLKEKKAMTMLNVLAAFAVLTLVLLLFGQAVNAALNLYRYSEDLRKASEARFSSFYKESNYDSGAGDYSLTEYSYTFKEEGGGTAFSTKVKMGEYEKDGGKIWFYGGRKKVGP